MEQDAAFGPMGLASAPQMPLNPDEVKELQRLLNTLGYGPVSITGDFDQRTSSALDAFERNLGGTGWTQRALISKMREMAAMKAVSQAKTPGEAVVASTALPFYKNPWVIGTVALAGLVGYIAWRSSSKSAAVSGADEDDAERTPPKRSSRKPKADKCGRVPDVDMAAGEVVELEAPPHGQEVTE